MLTESHTKLGKYLETIRQDSKNVFLVSSDTELLEKYLSDSAYREKFERRAERRIQKVESELGILVEDDQKLPFFLFSSHFRWTQVDENGPRLPLFGGFAFNNGKPMLTEPTDSWKKEHSDFLKYEEESVETAELFSNLIWFESPTPTNSSLFAPYYACVLPNQENFPHEFFFYDGGIIYSLPFKTYEEYIEALVKNVGVECWQYFYIAPEILKEKNKGLNYMTTELRKRTGKVKNLNFYEYDASLPFDRLDLIVEYLGQVVGFLPEGFPGLDFSHQKEYLQKIESLL